ncbi:MAG: hypothetical protein WD825_16035 [Gemmatimonadaceae bacterium]
MRKMLERRSPRWWAVSVAIHVVLVLALAQIMFRYPLGQLLGLPVPEVRQERLQYIALPPQPTENSSGARTATPSPAAAPAALQTPVSVPTTVPPPTDSSRAQAAGGTGTGFDAFGSGLATGLVPRQPDPRIALAPGQMVRRPHTVAEDVDSIVSLAIGIVQDSMAIAAAQRKPGDWTVKGKDGEVWGWDPNGNIRLGKFTIPGALLAMLPLNMQSRVGPIEARGMAYIRRDIMENAQRQITEDEFRASVKRIRERKERERREKMLADSKGTPQQ